MRVQGWDPVMIICQIISLQTIHYLTLSTILPPLLTSFTSPTLLAYAGGSSTVSHIMDWREMAARPTISKDSFPGVEGWRKLRGAWAGGKEIGSVAHPELEDGGEVDDYRVIDENKVLDEYWEYGVDDKRGWIIGGAWLVTFAVDILPLYFMIRRPTHILDFALTLIFNHFILTTYYSASFPTSFFFWLIQVLGAVLMVVVAEQMCVKREMQSELEVGWQPNVEAGQGLLDHAAPPPVSQPGSSAGGKGRAGSAEEIELAER
ncbi:hypothetical protein IAU60_000746 [Kwoniella sp. DSM 27419]